MPAGISEEYVVTLKAQVSNAIKSLRLFEKELDKSVDKSGKGTGDIEKQTKKMSSNVVRYIGSIAQAYVGMRTLIEGIDFNVFIEKNRVAFGVMLRDIDYANQKIRELRDFALTIPFTFKEVVAGARQLLAYGFAAEDLTKNLRMLGQVSYALSIPLGDLIYIYGTLRSQNQAYARDLMQFGMRGIPIYKSLAEILNVNEKQIKKMVEQAKVGFKDVEKAFMYMTGKGGQFEGMLQKAMETFMGMSNILKGVLQIWLGALTEGIFESLKEAIANLITIFKTSEQSARKFGNVIGTIFNNVINTFLGLLTVLSKIPPSIYIIVTAMIGGYGLTKAIAAIASSLHLLKGAFTLFSPQGMIIAGLSAALVLITSIIGRIRQAKIEAQRVAEDLGKELKKSLLMEGQYGAVAGVSKKIYEWGKRTGEWDRVLETAEKIAKIEERIVEIEEIRQRTGLFAGPKKRALENISAFIKAVTDYQDKLRETVNLHKAAGKSVEDFGYVLRLALQNIGKDASRVKKTYYEVFKAAEKIIPEEEMNQINELSDRLSLLTQRYDLLSERMKEGTKESRVVIERELGATKDNIEDTLGAIFELFRKYGADTSYLYEEIRKLEEALVGVVEGKAFPEWAKWVEDTLKVPIEEFRRTLDSGEVRYLGALAGKIFVTPLEDSVEASKKLSGVLGENTVYVETMQKAVSLVRDMLLQMVSATDSLGRKMFSFEKVFDKEGNLVRYGDRIVDVLVRFYLKYKQVLDTLQGDNEEAAEKWLDDWTKSFDKFCDNYKQYVAERTGTEILLERGKQAVLAREISEMTKAQFELAKKYIMEKYGIEVQNAEDLHRLLMDMLREEYDYRERMIRLEREQAAGDILEAIGKRNRYEQAYIDLLRERLQYLVESNILSQKELDNYVAIMARQRDIDEEVKAQQIIFNITKDREKLTRAELEIERSRLQYLVSENRLTQEQLDMYIEILNVEKQREEIRAKASRYEEMKGGDPLYWENMKASFVDAVNEGGADLVDYAKAASAEALANTELGALIAGADPILQLISAFTEAAMEIEEFSEVMNWATTIAQKAKEFFGKPLAKALEPVVRLLEAVGEVLGGVLSPIIEILGIRIKIFADILYTVIKFIYNVIIVNVFNLIITVINAFITVINTVLEAIGMETIPLINKLQKIIEETVSDQQDLADQINHVKDILNYLYRELEKIYRKEIESLRDLYEVGVISASQYEEAVKDLNEKYGDIIDKVPEEVKNIDKNVDAILAEIDKWEKILAILEGKDREEGKEEPPPPISKEVFDAIKKEKPQEKSIKEEEEKTFLDRIFSPIVSLFKNIGKKQTGSFNIPRNELDYLHKGEMVIPKDFADAIRSGKLSLTSGENVQSPINNYYINIEGTVIEERNLVRAIAEATEKQKRRGYISV